MLTNKGARRLFRQRPEKVIAAPEIEAARAIRIQDEVARRGGKLRRQGGYFVGACLVCGGDDRFSVKNNIKAQLWNCRGCGVGGDVIDFVRHVDRCGFARAIGSLIGDGARKPARAVPADREENIDEQKNLDRAVTVWRETTPLGRDAIAYFANRQIDINQAPGHGGLRFHPRCPWGKGSTPAVIGRFTTALGNNPQGIWRRPLNGEKPMTLGPTAGCVIRLWPDEAVERGLVLGEGPETVLAAATRILHRGTLLQPAWAAGGSGNVKKLPVLSGIEALTLLVDNDLPDQHDRRAGQDAAAKCAARWSAAGCEVIRLTPKVLDADFNDVVMHHGR
jgi:Toprim domain/CHC2 zinc finger